MTCLQGECSCRCTFSVRRSNVELSACIYRGHLVNEEGLCHGRILIRIVKYSYVPPLPEDLLAGSFSCSRTNLSVEAGMGPIA